MTLEMHVLGASGSGATTLGRALAAELGLAHLDCDDYYWEPSDPPYTLKRSPEERLRLLRLDLPESAWILSGSMVQWGDPLISLFTHVLLIEIGREARLERLRRREAERYGARILPGGDMHTHHREFMAWASRYDDGGLDVRSKELHERWIEKVACPILRVEGERPTSDQLAEIVPWIASCEGLS